MSDDTGATSYHYDSLSRMSSESRTFTGYSGTYTLNYSHNLANALTVLSIPFRSQQIGYNYDNAGRLSSVSGSGFSARYGLWPNVNTQSITSLASNIVYRAWGARKSMTYGNTTSEQTAYNSRLQPTTYTLNNMNYQNTNICCTNPTYSTMTWTFDYYNDGRVKTVWDSTNDWFDRAYKYDHAGRLKEASTYRRARGLSPYPSNPYHDPYYQNITYDAFNHTSRTGLLYTGEPSDVGTWVNNRRTGPGWQYDADGNTTIDPNFTQTFDAAGKPSHSVSFARVGDGVNYPYQPSTDIAQTYDGTGAPGKREQIVRQPDSGNGPPMEDIQTTYYLRSTVLGAAVVELNGPSASDIVNVYAGGQRIARDESENISFEHTNPVTGSRVTSAGYSTYRGTTRQERDSFGAEIPTSNPYPTASSYGDYKFGEQFYILGGDPFDYSTGREIDGMPVSETEFQRRMGNGSAVVDVFKGGRYVGSLDFSKSWSSSRITIAFDVFQPPLELDKHPELWPIYYVGTFTEEVELSGQVPTKPRIKNVPLGSLKTNLETLLKGDCGNYVQRLLNEVNRQSSAGYPHISTFWDGYNRIMGENGGGYQVDDVASNGGTVSGDLFARGALKGTVHLTPHRTNNREATPREIADAQNRYAYRAIHETFHLARQAGYNDYQLAVAAYSLENMDLPEDVPQDDVLTWSNRFDNFLKQHCRNDTTPIQK